MIRCLTAASALVLLSACAMPTPQPVNPNEVAPTTLTLTGSRIPHRIQGRVDGVKVMSREEVADSMRHERRPVGDSNK